MTPERLWERFDEADKGNAHQMKSIAQDAIDELLKTESKVPRIRPDLYNNLIIEIMETTEKYGNTQQCRTHISKVISKYVVADHPHTRGK